MGKKPPSSMIKVQDDRAGSQELSKLLHRMHTRVVEVIIRGTFGYEYLTDVEFRGLNYTSNVSAGVYLNTIAVHGNVSDRGKSFNVNELEKVIAMIEE
ncbi:hypothetical protein PVAG01_07541 [Phlyctema vagabunda]|uniref:Uncharacterized protein n=1 Tax=Phlyctema vagabunda TaxID=108571 RepID=A0ABR4PCQ5_9HELO